MVRKESIEAYLQRLSSSDPTPGGGGAAALSGALGCALGRMVANLTTGRRKYADVEEEMRETEQKLKDFEEAFLRLSDRDEEAFSAFMDVLKLPKETEEEKAVRRDSVHQALLHATEVPLQTMEKAVEALRAAVPAAEKGNKNAVSDAGAAANMLLSALETGAENVRINLASMKNEEERAAFEARMNALLEEGRVLALRIRETVHGRMAGE